jgi:hypothetical protein
MKAREVERSMSRSTVAALLIAATLVSMLPPGHAQSSPSLLVNVHTASALGCGDYGAGPHYSYRIFVNGVQVGESGTWNPTEGAVQFFDLTTVPLGGNTTVTVSFEVDDHASIFFFGESVTPCNLTSNDQARYSFSYTVGQPQLVRSAGVHVAAGIEAYVSDTTLGTPLVPTARLDG